MYIDKWWGDYFGSTDDSCVLLDYFAKDGVAEYPLSKIFADFGLYEQIQWGDFQETEEIEFTDDEGISHEIDIVMNLIMDLSAITLESIHNGGVSLSELDESTPNPKRFVIQPDADELDCLTEALLDFSKNPEEYDLSDLCAPDDLKEMAVQCQKLAEELKSHCE